MHIGGMHIGLNLLYIRRSAGGVWNYVENLLQAIAEHDEVNRYTAFTTEEGAEVVPQADAFHSVCIDTNPQNRLKRIWHELTSLDRLVRQHDVDCMYWFGNVRQPTSSVPGLVVVHDLRAFWDPGSYSLIRGMYMRAMTRWTASQEDRVLMPVSQSTANHISEYLSVQEEQFILPVALPPRFRPVEEQRADSFKKKHALPEEYWVYVAHTFPHKNHVRLLRAYRHLLEQAEEPWPLVLRGDPKGAEPEIQATIEELELRPHIIRLPRLEREEMPCLYSAATALVYPSTFEGGGIPVTEAMACGCPALVSDIPVIHEFARDAALYMNVQDVSEMTDAMLRLQTDEKLRRDMARKGRGRAKHFSGERVVRRQQSALDHLFGRSQKPEYV